MRLHLQSLMARNVALAAVGFIFVVLSAPALAAELDPASAVRGSLGASLGELSLSNGGGRLAFLLNGAFALLCGALVAILIGKRSRVLAKALRRHAVDYDSTSRTMTSVTGQNRV
jgi:hypothetical protein